MADLVNGHMERLVREVAASAFSSTIGDVTLIFQGGQQVFICIPGINFFIISDPGPQESALPGQPTVEESSRVLPQL